MGHFVERTQFLLCRRQSVESCKAHCVFTCVRIQFFAQASHEFRLVSGDGKRAAEKQQITGLYGLDVSAKRSRWRREFDAKLGQPPLRVAWLRALVAYHLPACAPPSTCNTSPVT